LEAEKFPPCIRLEVPQRWLHRFALIHEHHGFAAVEDHPILQVITDGACQHPPFNVANLANEIVGPVAMADPLDILVDDRTFVERAGHIMRVGADQFDTALMRLMVGPCSLETRQKRVMNVDAAAG
jgi:hypothetical protein